MNNGINLTNHALIPTATLSTHESLQPSTQSGGFDFRHPMLSEVLSQDDINRPVESMDCRSPLFQRLGISFTVILSGPNPNGDPSWIVVRNTEPVVRTSMEIEAQGAVETDVVMNEG